VVKIPILLADPQSLTHAGIQFILQSNEEFEIVGSIKDATQLKEQIQALRPSVLILDYFAENFISVSEIADALKQNPVNTLIITADTNRERILRVVQLGVTGFLTKECSEDEILRAIQSTARGEKFYCHTVLEIILSENAGGEKGNRNSSRASLLTDREAEVLLLLAHGKSTLAIADAFCLSPHTVHTHRKNIIRKLSIKSPTEFVVHALDLGLMKTLDFNKKSS
jgi:two-component system, NarL family, invasion response regulator UvrY